MAVIFHSSLSENVRSTNLGKDVIRYDQPDSTWSNFGLTLIVWPIEDLWCQGEKVLRWKKTKFKNKSIRLWCMAFRFSFHFSSFREWYSVYSKSDYSESTFPLPLDKAYLRLILPSLFNHHPYLTVRLFEVSSKTRIDRSRRKLDYFRLLMRIGF